MVEVFKTNVQKSTQAKWLTKKLVEHFPADKINFDLSDCDKILRVEGQDIPSQRVVEFLNAHDYQCEVLE